MLLENSQIYDQNTISTTIHSSDISPARHPPSVQGLKMGSSSSEAEYNAFLKKVQRTIYVDNLSPQVTEMVMRAAFEQFGEVVSIQFIQNYFEPKNMPVAALVEMESPKQAQAIVGQMENYPFMVLGMPRPISIQEKPLDVCTYLAEAYLQEELQCRSICKAKGEPQSAICNSKR
ncbi:RNA-binding (RRM/RBD/RNP motifs) family protein [Striga hermonthica]|uniref:RNA-binding (RRM/RBD/RNP motifs) family protein n=1 Tax=Striga hermonthica TaxID=68872 RepID=A0A9N7NAZ8_STRHE|nr:RNA-binding (RRM/RBD/RNP motifs) family protein [Striga hermonthica]